MGVCSYDRQHGPRSGAALQRIAQDPEVLETMFEMLETQRLIDGEGRITLVPKGTGMLAPLVDAAVPRKA
jgi:hypothetical protein